MTFFKTILLTLVLVNMTACGIKPKHLAPPSTDEEGRATVTYPRTYPDPTL